MLKNFIMLILSRKHLYMHTSSDNCIWKNSNRYRERKRGRVFSLSPERLSRRESRIERKRESNVAMFNVMDFSKRKYPMINNFCDRKQVLQQLLVEAFVVSEVRKSKELSRPTCESQTQSHSICYLSNAVKMRGTESKTEKFR